MTIKLLTIIEQGKEDNIMDDTIRMQIEEWIKEFEKTRNVDINEDTFEGSAYYLFKAILGAEF